MFCVERKRMLSWRKRYDGEEEGGFSSGFPRIN
jgi:hypothetical protein